VSNPFPQQSRRAVYRVVYPAAERPHFLVDAGQAGVAAGDCEVIDCSELGLRYQATGSPLPAVGDTVEGRVVFRRGVEVPVAGEVVRVQEAKVALWFRTLALSFTVIVAEQEYLLGRGYTLSEVT
jgi:hypothetical protein